MKKNHEEKLTPYLSKSGAWAMSLGTTIGWGSLFIISTVYLRQAGVLGSLIGLAIGACIMLIISRSYHYMMNSIQESGGAYNYAKDTFGYDHGFINSWFIFLTYLAIFWANATSLTLFARYFLGDIFKFGFHYTIFGYDVYFGEILISALAMLLVAFVCSKNKKTTSRINLFFAITFVIGISTCFIGMLIKKPDVLFNLKPLFLPNSNAMLQILRIICISPWAFIGFENISHFSEEFTFPHKKAFKVLCFSIIVALILYSFIIIISASSYPPEYNNWLEYINDLNNISGLKGLPTFFSANNYLGNFGQISLIISMFGLVITSLIGNMTALTRLLYGVAKDGIISKSFTKLNKHSVPYRTIGIVLACSLFIPFLGRAAIGWIVDVTTIGATIIFGFVCASAWKMAKSRNDKLDKNVGLIGLIIMCVFAIYLLFFNFLSINSMEAESYFLFTIWSVLGFVFFFHILKNDNAKKFGKSTVVWMALLLIIIFTSLVWMNKTTMNSTEEILEHLKSQSTNSIEMDDEIAELRSNNLKAMFVVVVLFVVSLAIHIALQKKHEALEKEKMRVDEESRAKSQFLFNMSHDIRTPLNAIIGFTHLAKQDNVSLENKNEYLSKIESSGQELLGIINDVLDMSRIENGKIELEPIQMNLEEVLAKVQDMFNYQMKEKDISFVMECMGVKDKWVLCDKKRFNRILLNLISNAYKFTNKGGKISVIIIETNRNEDKGQYELHVKDNGIGMSKEFEENIFKPFERERTSTVSGIQGTGLGLSIAKGIVDMMNGTIEVSTEEGKGTEFIVKVELPIIDNPDDELIAIEKNEKIDYSKTRILIVEDNEINMEIAKSILLQAGFMIETAENGKQALEMVKESEVGYYDLILMDVQMPIMNGYEATTDIRKLENKELANIPIVAMTANVFQEDIQAAKSVGMNDHIAKPLDVKKMIETINNTIIQSKNKSV